MTQAEEKFTRQDIETALTTDGVDPNTAAIVLGALDNLVESRRAVNESSERTNTVINMAKAYERTKGSDSNIEGWHEELMEHSYHLLVLAGQTRGGLSKKEIETAALTYTHLINSYGDTPEEELLSAAGVEPSWVLDVFKEAFKKAYPTQQLEAEALEDLTDQYLFDPVVWADIVGSRFDELRPVLIAAGYELPELRSDGRYQEEVDEEREIYGEDNDESEGDN